MNLSFLTSFYFLLAIYMVAFLINGRSIHYFLAFIASEFIGRFSLFSWAITYEWGVFMHLIWSIIYALCFMFFWLSLSEVNKKNKLTMLLTVVMILFQFVMALDCKWSEGNATFLYNSYKYLIIIIHCYIVSTFIKWGNIIAFMDEHVIGIRGIFGGNGYFMFYWYNKKNDNLNAD